MRISWLYMHTYVGVFLGLFFGCLVVSWLIIKYKDWQKREILAYTDFKKDLFATSDQQVLMLPGTISIFSPEQVIALEHCQRLLLKEKDQFQNIRTDILVACPFKYAILTDFITEHSIKARVEFLSIDGTSFVSAALGYIDRTEPAVTFLNGAFGIECLMLGDTANNYGVTYQGSDQKSPLSDGAFVAKGLFICEEMYALPSFEGETMPDKVFLLANDLCRALIICIIIFFSTRSTFIELVKLPNFTWLQPVIKMLTF